MADLIGKRLGQYEITGRLGVGGMATVYRAQQLNIKREVAIKVIKGDLSDSPDFIKRFEREAQTVASLSHPHILKLFDYGQSDDQLYLVTEIMTGGSLDKLIRQGPMDFASLKRITCQIASALDYAHQQGIIHRDLKPQNVLLDNNRNAYLTDFGIAKLLHDSTSLTQSGMTMGTPSYMAPEQWRGEAIDSRADIYAFGVMLYEMLSSKLPFNGDTPMSMMYMHLHDSPPPIYNLRPDVPQEVGSVLDKALAKDRAQRYQSAGLLDSAFKDALENRATEAPIGLSETVIGQPELPKTQVGSPLPPPALPSAPDLATPGNRSMLPLIGVGVVVIAIIAIGAFLLGNRGNLPAQTSTSTTVAAAVVSSATSNPIPTSTSTLILATTAPNTATIAAKPANTATQVATSSKVSTTQPSTLSPFVPQGSSTGKIAFAVNNNIVLIDTQTGNTEIAFRAGATIQQSVWSPDGKQVLYQDKVVFIVNADGTNQRQLSIPTDQMPSFPDLNNFYWSPDSTKIAFHSDTAISIFNAADGKLINTLADNLKKTSSVRLAWSPDGKQIAFVDNLNFNIINTDGSNLHILPNSQGSETDPAWSPDGKQIAFVNINYLHPYIGVVNADGSNYHPVAKPDQVDLVQWPTWSPDGTQIAFIASSLAESGTSLYVVHADGSNLQIASEKTHGEMPSWSPDSKQLVYLSHSAGKIIVVDAKDLAPHLVSLAGLADQGNYFPMNATWIPDSTTVLASGSSTSPTAAATSAASTTASGLITFLSNGDLYKADLADERANLLFHSNSSNDGYIFIQVLSPSNNTEVLLQGKSSAFILTEDGKQTPLDIPADQLTPTPDALKLYAWSPDGTQVAFQSDTGIAIYDASTGKLIKNLVSMKMNTQGQLAWSPDGQYIAFSAKPNSGDELFVVKLDGSAPQSLNQPDFTYASDPTWSPSSDQIAFSYSSMSDGPDFLLGVINADGSNFHKVTKFADPVIAATAWSPDSQQIAVIARDNGGSAHLYLVNPDGSNLRKVSGSAPSYDHRLSWSLDSQYLLCNTASVPTGILLVDVNAAAAHELPIRGVAASANLNYPVWVP